MRASRRFKQFMTFKSCLYATIIVILNIGIAVAESDMVSDAENCLLCHRYPNMGRYDEKGLKRILYVNDKQFIMSVHGNLKCKSCHVGLDKIPHTNVDKVDCSAQCHIREPSTNREFSHENMVKKFEMSVHGKGKKEKPKPFPEDLPTCTYCHDNTIYNTPDGIWGKSQALSNETLARCAGCHTKIGWAENFYKHFTHRMRRRRSPDEVVRLCTSCHEDKDKMLRHGLETIDTYKDTFHWTQVKFGVDNAPDCISCHVPVGYTTHEILPKNDPMSPINIRNRLNTCTHQGGLQTCHPGATPKFATGRVHSYGLKAQLAATNRLEDNKRTDASLINERAEIDMTKKEIFRYKVIKWIKIFYMIFIAAVVGSMFLHQCLDFLRHRKK